MRLKRIFIRMTLAISAVLTASPQMALSKEGTVDPWRKLKDAFPAEEKTEENEAYDPWKELRRVYLPFTQEEEEEAVLDTGKAAPFSRKLSAPLEPYRALIKECSRQFKVPEEIIGAVILVESGGNNRAAARTSSARGLMQTIRSTFEDARNALKNQGIEIENDPFNPRSSIYAGSWYLNYVFEQASSDNPGKGLDRSDIEHWCTPATYYYAGPADGSRRDEIIIKYIDGKKLVVDKPTYCNKVMRYARLLKTVMG